MEHLIDTKILIVDDMSVIRLILKKALLEIGITNVVEAYCGNKAWELYKDAFDKGEEFELIISDWNMAPGSGMDLLKKIRKLRKVSELPFLMLTAETESKCVAEAKQEGATGYISKPFSKEMLQGRVKEIIFSKFQSSRQR